MAMGAGKGMATGMADRAEGCGMAGAKPAGEGIIGGGIIRAGCGAIGRAATPGMAARSGGGGLGMIVGPWPGWLGPGCGAKCGCGCGEANCGAGGPNCPAPAETGGGARRRPVRRAGPDFPATDRRRPLSAGGPTGKTGPWRSRSAIAGTSGPADPPGTCPPATLEDRPPVGSLPGWTRRGRALTGDRNWAAVHGVESLAS